MDRPPARALVAALVVGAALLALAASAHAFAVTSVTATPTAPSGGPLPPSGPTAAGAHPDLAIGIDFEPGAPVDDGARSLEIGLAPGIVANVQNVATCTSWDAGSPAETDCPRSVVGTTSTSVVARLTAPIPPILPAGDVPLTLPGTIYKVPSPDPARYPTALGIEIPSSFRVLGFPPIKLVSPITVDPSNLGLVATLDGLPRTAASPIGELPIHIERITQTLHGYVDGGRPFFTNPTACIPAAVTVRATSHAGVASANAGAYTPTDCEHVPFDATFATSADPATADTTAAISFDLRPSQLDVPRASAHVRTTTVVAPPGVLLNAARAAGLDACTDAQFAQGNPAVAAACPPSSQVGTISFASPILGEFPGTAYFGSQTPTDRLRLFLDVPLFGAHIKVQATVNPDLRTGQVTTRFSALPQIAFSSFRLTFAGGPTSALVTPASCGEHVATAIVAPWSGGPEIRPTGAFTTTDCARAFAPGFGVAVAPDQAGAASTFTLVAERPDRQVPVGRMAFELPPGLVGALALPGLTRCPLAQAAAQACPASSKVGDVVSVVGSGSAPPSLGGVAYLTEPKQPGDVAGLSIQVPARLGPVDAGTVIVGVRLLLRDDGSLHVLSDDIPALQLGIPLAIRRLTVAINRAGFMRNPTSCGRKGARATFAPIDGGPDATASASIAVQGCDALPFAPRMAARVGARGRTRVNAHPPFTTVITQGGGQAALRTVRVKTPVAMSTDIRTVGAACLPAALAQGRCAPSARVAEATAVSPLVRGALRGPAWLVKRDRGLPKLVVQLRGPASIDLEGIVTTDRRNALITTFADLPDLTISRFALRFRGGRGGIFTNVRNLCARPLLTNVRFVGHNGRATTQRRRLPVAGCPPLRPRAGGTVRLRRGGARLGLAVRAPAGRRLARVRVALPRGLALDRAARRAVIARAGRRRLGRQAVRAGARAVVVRAPRRGAARVSVLLRGVDVGSQRLARRLDRRRGALRVRVGTRLRGGPRAVVRAPVRIR